MQYLLIGLGNPGAAYNRTRHNVGFELIDRIAAAHEAGAFANKFESMILSTSINSSKLLLAKPLTYMNNSGIAVSKILHYYKMSCEQLFVLHDDLDLECGKIKIKVGGGSGGHNGLTSIDQHIGNQYHRIRIGISKPCKQGVADYVLQKFTDEQRVIIDNVLDRIEKNIEILLGSGKDKFLLAFHK